MFYYIFNKDNECDSICYSMPDIKDLNKRGEVCIEDERNFINISLLRNNNGKIEISSPKPKEPTYEEILDGINNKIAEERTLLENRDIKYNNDLYQVDSASLNRLTLASKLDDSIEWKTSTNTITILTKEDINNILKLVAERNSEIFSYISDAKDKVKTIEQRRKEGSISEEEAKKFLEDLNETLYI